MRWGGARRGWRRGRVDKEAAGVEAAQRRCGRRGPAPGQGALRPPQSAGVAARMTGGVPVDGCRQRRIRCGGYGCSGGSNVPVAATAGGRGRGDGGSGRHANGRTGWSHSLSVVSLRIYVFLPSLLSIPSLVSRSRHPRTLTPRLLSPTPVTQATGTPHEHQCAANDDADGAHVIRAQGGGGASAPSSLPVAAGLGDSCTVPRQT